MFFRSIETAVLGVLPVVPLLCSPTASSTAKEIDTHLISPKKRKRITLMQQRDRYHQVKIAMAELCSGRVCRESHGLKHHQLNNLFTLLSIQEQWIEG